MPTSRYAHRKIRTNYEESFKEILESRGIGKVEQYLLNRFGTLTTSERNSINVIKHMWTTGDSYQKLSQIYYDSPSYWWVIGWYNSKPTDSHNKLGEVISIPFPLQLILQVV